MPIRRIAVRVFLIGSCMLIMAGCASTRSGRIEQHQSEFDAYPAAVQSQIRAGEIDVGFAPEMVRMSMGEPADVATFPDLEGPVTVWTFLRPWPRRALGQNEESDSPFSAILGFRNGRLAHAFLFGEVGEVGGVGETD